MSVIIAASVDIIVATVTMLTLPVPASIIAASVTPTSSSSVSVTVPSILHKILSNQLKCLVQCVKISDYNFNFHFEITQKEIWK